jgi:tight adherence protein B
MTTLVIQQRAGGDTVRAMSELGSTLEARKDLQREIRTMLSGAVFTSYLVMIMGVGTIVLINVISPGVLRQMTGSLLGIVALTIAALLYAVAYVFIRQITRVET